MKAVDEAAKAEANEANEAKANEAVFVDEADLSDEAVDATEANKAKANDAKEACEAKATEADKANKADLYDKAVDTTEADEAKATGADKADEANLPNVATDVNKANKADPPNKAVDATEADEAEATEADKADEAEAIDAAIVLFFIIANIVIVIPRSQLDEGIVIVLYSLTKYSAVFAKRKGYFGIMISNNQCGIGRQSLCFWVVFGILMSSIMHWVGLDSSSQSFLTSMHAII